MAPSHRELRDIAALFGRLGATAFGGPAVHIALMRHEVVSRRRWMTDGEFLDLLAATNLIPGPNSTEMAIHIGRCRAGGPGLVIAGLAFILPATAIVALLAWLYQRFGTQPPVVALLYGLLPVVIAIVAHAIGGLAKSAIASAVAAVIAISAIVLSLLGVHELIVLAAGGAAAAAAHAMRTMRRVMAVDGVTLAALFGVFVKAGATLFGSGYVLLAYLRADLVERLGWMTEKDLLTAISIGQVTPGPVFTTATFVGWMLAGPAGAAVATTGIFLPAFFFVAATGPLIPRLRRSPTAGAALDGLNAASLALMAVVTWQIARVALVDWLTVAVAATALLLLWRTRLNPAWLILGGALAGLAAPV